MKNVVVNIDIYINRAKLHVVHRTEEIKGVIRETTAVQDSEMHNNVCRCCSSKYGRQLMQFTFVKTFLA